MSTISDGGNAFPALEKFEQFDDERGRYVEHYAPHGGMKLRDYFAAQALIGVLANLSEMDPNVRSGPHSCERFARDCYRMADAMIAARGEGK